MRRRFVLVLTLLASLLPAVRYDAAAVPDLKETIATLERQLPDLVKEARIPGLAIAVVDGGRVVWARGLGMTAVPGGVAVTEDTVFEAASLSKPVTAFVTLQLVDQGKLRLDAPLADYVTYPDLPDDSRARTITARHVLSHTTGFANWRRRDPLKLFFAPGDRFSYSGEGYVYLQLAIEAIAKEPLDAVARRLVFEPLSMPRSTFLKPESGVVASPHTDIGTPLPIPPPPPTANAAASLRSTAPEYARLLVAALNGTALKPATAKLMLSPQVQLDPACINCTDRPTAKPAADVGWGLGWGLEQTSDGLAIWHWGDNPGFKAYVTANVAARRGFVYFTNGDAGLSIRDRLVGIVLGGKHPALAQVQYRQVGQPGGARSGPTPVLPGAPAVSRPSRLPQALPSADWAHADPGVAGWSKDALAESATLAQSIGSAAILVVDNGHVVWEWGDTTRKYQCHSVRKSLLSALYGQAVARKQIDLSRTLAALGIDDDPPALSAAEKRATVRDLLMARSGVYHPAVYETAGMAASRPARESHAPGTFWYYNNWDFNALGTIYERETRTTICDAFRTQIAVPIRLQDYAAGDCTIFRGPESRHTAYPFRMSSRDLARVGLLFMNIGRWDGKEIVPPSWVDESTKPWTDLGIRGGYGYMWWAARNGDHYPFLKLPDGTFSARGVGEQNLVVIPAWGLVIVHRTNTDAGDPTITVTDFGRLLQKILSARR